MTAFSFVGFGSNLQLIDADNIDLELKVLHKSNQIRHARSAEITRRSYQLHCLFDRHKTQRKTVKIED